MDINAVLLIDGEFSTPIVETKEQHVLQCKCLFCNI